MHPILFASLLNTQLWHLVPLVIAVSLVYGATRHELMGPIIEHAYRAGVWIVGFMAIIFAILFVVSWNL
jgi:hypothetical protein